MSREIVIPDPRTGFSMKIDGVILNRPDLHLIAAELSIQPKDVLFENGRLTIFNTSLECQEIIDDNALASFVALAIDHSPEIISDIQPAKAKPKVLSKDDFIDDEDED